ncbi:hypothetical protein [Pseudolysinimonas sp.]|uniref:hypothetical protein n=1 Tax=Pseudolysinimonas sp. TaxID=2680009 RepID=UPI003F80B63E
MTRTHRLWNRLVLVLIGLALLAVAGIAALPLLPSGARPVTAAALGAVVGSTVGLVAIVAAAVVLVVLAILWIVTRGRGRIRDVVGQGDLAVDDRVVAGLLRDALADRPAVLGVHAQAYRQRRPVVYARIAVRRSADLPPLLADVDRAAATAAERLGARPPLVVHLTSGLVARASGTRIAR